MKTEKDDKLAMDFIRKYEELYHNINRCAFSRSHILEYVRAFNHLLDEFRGKIQKFGFCFVNKDTDISDDFEYTGFGYIHQPEWIDMFLFYFDGYNKEY